MLKWFSFSFILLVFLYDRYRSRLKNNRILQAQGKKMEETSQELQQMNELQQKLLTEKEWLLKEIHHRVKNNLQIVISLLNAQSDFLDSPSALHAIRESRERMEAIALIHQKLYQPGNNMLIDMGSYIQEMVAYLDGSFTEEDGTEQGGTENDGTGKNMMEQDGTEQDVTKKDGTGKITFRMNMADVRLDVSQAVPVGLILNEAITNAIRHAFPPGQAGVITISLQKRADAPDPANVPERSNPFTGTNGPEASRIANGPEASGIANASDLSGRADTSNFSGASPHDILLTIADNGQGLPESFDLSASNSLGIQLMKLFAEQLEGDIDFESRSRGGITITLSFKEQANIV